MKSGSVSGSSMYRIIIALVLAAVLASENQEPMARIKDESVGMIHC